MVSAASVMGTLLVVRDSVRGPRDTHQGDEHADDHDVHRDPLSAALDLRRSYGKWLPMGNKATLTALRSPAQYGCSRRRAPWTVERFLPSAPSNAVGASCPGSASIPRESCS